MELCLTFELASVFLSLSDISTAALMIIPVSVRIYKGYLYQGHSLEGISEREYWQLKRYFYQGYRLYHTSERADWKLQHHSERNIYWREYLRGRIFLPGIVNAPLPGCL